MKRKLFVQKNIPRNIKMKKTVNMSQFKTNMLKKLIKQEKTNENSKQVILSLQNRIGTTIVDDGSDNANYSSSSEDALADIKAETHQQDGFFASNYTFQTNV